jgi:hypothetical protein
MGQSRVMRGCDGCDFKGSCSMSGYPTCRFPKADVYPPDIVDAMKLGKAPENCPIRGGVEYRLEEDT